MIVKTIPVSICRFQKTTFFAFAFIFLSIFAYAQERSVFELLSSTSDITEITIVTDMEMLLANKKTNEDQKATLIWHQGNERMEFDIELQSRGRYRRRVCDFPPLKLKFAKEDLTEKGLNHHNKLKLVTHCMEKKQEGNENVAKEYLVYQLYRQLTSNSYRAKLFVINYQDVNKPKAKPLSRYGILIEDTDEMAERLGGEECECRGIEKDSVSIADESMMSVFQYMIGNLDWEISTLRNLKLVKQPDGMVIPVPYDFDFSGVVNASYAVPNVDLGSKSILDRIFLGYFPHSDVLKQTLDKYKAEQANILGLVLASDQISAPEKERIKEYLIQFYDNLDKIMDLSSPRSLQN